MGLLRSAAGYDRARILDAAARARARRKRSRAIELYRWVLALEPGNGEIHARLAPLLAETGQHFDAWCSFRSLARAHLRDGHPDKALAVYRDATLYLPREVQAWQAAARLQHRDGRAGEAVETLLEGSRRFRTRWLRPQAIFLLRRAREIDPWNFEVVIELAQLLASSQQGREARLLLDGLAARESGDRLWRVRMAQLRVCPGPRSFWRLARTLLGSDPDSEADATPQQPSRSAVVSLHAARRR